MIVTKKGIKRNFGISPFRPSTISLFLKTISSNSHSKDEATTTGSLSATVEEDQQQQQPNATAATNTARYNGPQYPNEMNQKQKEIYQSILKSRPNTGISGPFGPWLSIPAIAEPASQLGKVLRYDTSLSHRESELIILLTATKMKSNTEFQIHKGEALKAGLSMDLISAIHSCSGDNNDFSFETVMKNVIPLLEHKNNSSNNRREKAIVAFTAELLDTGTVSDKTYESTKVCLDNKDSVLVEITSIIGYYTYVAYTLNVFRIPFSK